VAAHARPPASGPPSPADRPGERLAPRVSDASLQVQVSDDVRDDRLDEHPRLLTSCAPTTLAPFRHRADSERPPPVLPGSAPLAFKGPGWLADIRSDMLDRRDFKGDSSTEVADLRQELADVRRELAWARAATARSRDAIQAHVDKGCPSVSLRAFLDAQRDNSPLDA